MKKILKFTFFLFLISILSLIGVFKYSLYKLEKTSPTMPISVLENDTVKALDKEIYVLKKNWVKKNKYNIWEIYIEGSAFERGKAYGKLLKEPIQYQEKIFFKRIEKIVPSKIYRWFLNKLIVVFNSNINTYISEEIKQELLGASLSRSDEFDFIADKYFRSLAYHGAHDLGHALSNYALVGCTSFSTWGEKTKDKNIIHARNFDFYFGEDFAKEKVVLIVQPDTGYAFISYSWPGMMGVVSGMNEKGLAITINAGSSSPPKSAKEPISLVVREALQFSKNLKEAKSIISKKETFVSESIMISSKEDNETIIIEKTPTSEDIFSANNTIICSNHFQSEIFINDSLNIKNINYSDSKYRFDRTEELINNLEYMDVISAIAILRNRNGIGNIQLGQGNPKAINQLLAHHGVVFEPNKSKMWISTPPYQLGEFICYNLDSLFNKEKIIDPKTQKFEMIIEKDSFLLSEEFRKFKTFKKITNTLNDYLIFDAKPPVFNIEEFILLNPESYETYYLLGRYYLKQKDLSNSKKFLLKTLTKELPSKAIEKEIESYLSYTNN